MFSIYCCVYIHIYIYVWHCMLIHLLWIDVGFQQNNATQSFQTHNSGLTTLPAFIYFQFELNQHAMPVFLFKMHKMVYSGLMPKFWWKHRKTNPARILISKILEVSNIRDGFITKKEMLAMSKRLSVDQVLIVRADQSKYRWSLEKIWQKYDVSHELMILTMSQVLLAIRTGTIPDQTIHEK